MTTTKLKKTSARAESWIKGYFNSHYFSINQFYGRYSQNKARAESDCIDRMNSINGKGYKVLGGNSSFFTCGYLSDDENTLYIETHCNTFEIPLTD